MDHRFKHANENGELRFAVISCAAEDLLTPARAQADPSLRLE
jgi:hypothetical protein